MIGRRTAAALALTVLGMGEPAGDPAAAMDVAVGAGVTGIAFVRRGNAVWLAVASPRGLAYWDENGRGPIAPGAPAASGLEPLVVVGRDVYDTASGRSRAPVLPPAWTCSPRSFSADGGRSAAHCLDAANHAAMYVHDTRTGALVAALQHGDVRDGWDAELSPSGNLLMWTTTDSGALREIASRRVDPPILLGRRSAVSPDDTKVFTTVDRTLAPGNASQARVRDRAGHPVFALPRDVDRVVFSRSGKLLAAHHSRKWGGAVTGPSARDLQTVTLHGTTRSDVLVRFGDDDVGDVAIAPDDSRVALLKGTLVRIYAVPRP
jgi:hypothetical protein